MMFLTRTMMMDANDGGDELAAMMTIAHHALRDHNGDGVPGDD